MDGVFPLLRRSWTSARVAKAQLPDTTGAFPIPRCWRHFWASTNGGGLRRPSLRSLSGIKRHSAAGGRERPPSQTRQVPCRLTPEVAHAPRCAPVRPPGMRPVMASPYGCAMQPALTAARRHATRAECTRQTARSAGRAARRIDPGETVFDAMSLPSRSTRVRVGSIGELQRGYLPLFPLVDAAYGRAVVEETHEETLGESLPPFAFMRTTINAGRMTRVASRQEDGYRHARLHLHAEARPSRRVVGRRFVPPGILTSEPRPGRERPRVWNANLFPGPSRGSLTSWLPVWQPPTLPSAKIGWYRSHGRAAPAFHAPRQEVGTWGGSRSAKPVPGQPRASHEPSRCCTRADDVRGLAADGRRARCGQVDGSARRGSRERCHPRFVRQTQPAITRPSMELCSAPSRSRRCAPTARVHVRGFGP